MEKRPEWITNCDENCPIVHHEKTHVLWDFVAHLKLGKENYLFTDSFKNNIVLQRIVCFWHSLIHDIDLNNVNIIIWI